MKNTLVLPLPMPIPDACENVADLFQTLAELCSNGVWQVAMYSQSDPECELLQEYFSGIQQAANHFSRCLERD